MTPDEIVAGYPQITLADVHAALAYYHAHRDEIQRHMTEDEEFVEKLRRDDLASALTKRGKEADGDHASS